MSALSSTGTRTGGRGDGQLPLWRADAPAAVALFRGASGQWVDDQRIVCAMPAVGHIGFQPAIALAADGFVPTLVDLTPYGYDTFEVNTCVAGGGYWAVWNPEHGAIGNGVPPQYATWTPMSFSRTGTRVFLKNGVWAILWEAGLGVLEIGAEQVQACAGCVVIVTQQTIHILRPGQLPFIPAQRPGQKWDARVVEGTAAQWVGYLSDELGTYIVHPTTDAVAGYRIHVGDTFAPEATALNATPDAALVSWSDGAGVQAADLRRTALVLGQGMVPFAPPVEPPVEPPIPPNPEPEPDPMPPTDPLKPGKTADAYWDALAAAVKVRTKMDLGVARQGIKEAWDQLNAAKDWMNGNALVRGAFCRSGSDAIKIPQTALDLLSPDARAIDLEFLQR